jgi:hypothetical protein
MRRKPSRKQDSEGLASKSWLMIQNHMACSSPRLPGTKGDLIDDEFDRRSIVDLSDSVL